MSTNLGADAARHFRLLSSSSRNALPVPWAATIAATTSPTPEELFIELDGREIERGGDRVPVEVYSICDRAGHRWLQVGLHGATPTMLILEVPPTDSPDRVLETIAAVATIAEADAVSAMI